MTSREPPWRAGAAAAQGEAHLLGVPGRDPCGPAELAIQPRRDDHQPSLEDRIPAVQAVSELQYRVALLLGETDRLQLQPTGELRLGELLAIAQMGVEVIVIPEQSIGRIVTGLIDMRQDATQREASQ